MARLTLEALLAHSIDYAGLFPPASLPVEEAVANYRHYRQGPFAWMLGRFVVDEGRLPAIPEELDGHLALIAERDHDRAAVLETKSIVVAPKPVYCEASVQHLDAVVEVGTFAKIRTGGLTPEAIPCSTTLAQFIYECARRRLPFKATAGLHHPIRSVQPLTNNSDSPRVFMHGFINVLFASTLAWRGAHLDTIVTLLEETDPSAFAFERELRWREQRLRFEDVVSARRNFIHSFGSCSFLDPIHGLEQLACL